MEFEAWENGQTVELHTREKQAYIDYVQNKNQGQKIEYIKIIFENEFANIEYKITPQPFQRIRRITGYLVGDTTTWNDYKKAELKDRVKHRL